MRDSIFYSTIRAFFVALFGVFGFIVGLIVLIAAIGAMSSTTLSEPEASFSQKVVANAEGERKTTLGKDVPVILQLNIDGIIGAEGLTMQTIRKLLVESREGDLKNDRVKGIILHINSPGGTVVDADGIYRALKTYKEQYKVPVYAYVDGLCASGGMYVAAAADKIYASDVSLIGSVGVVSPAFLNFTDLISKIGVQALTLTAGKDKDVLNPLRPWKPGEEKEIQDIIDYYYKLFVNIVTTNRPEIDKTKLVDDYGAKVFDPIQAKEYGFINEAGYGPREALKKLLEEVKITDNNYQVIEMQHKSWYSELFGSESSLLKGKVKHQLDLGTELDPNLANQFLYLYRP